MNHCPLAQRSFLTFFVISGLLLCVNLAQATIGISYQMQLGNPSGATADTNNHNHYLIQRATETIDYSDNLREPNWASWDLTAGDVGSSGRSSTFFQDTTLPAGFYQVQTTDYTGSGWDRGHMCPSGDRTDTVAHNDEVFFMSNIIPQSPDNNQGVWANLESYCRTVAQAGNEVLITCGPEGFNGSRVNGNGPVFIASNVWKIIVVVPVGTGTALSRITTSTRVIAVNTPNIAGVRSTPWQNFLTSVNQLQTNTGYTFFSSLPTNIAQVLRAKVDGAPPPGITTFTPSGGNSGSTVTINGSNFTANSTVAFNGGNAAFTFNSASQLTATVLGGATTGPITVIAPGGLATSPANFAVTSVPPPALTIRLTQTNTVIVTWPSPSTGFVLQHSPGISNATWTVSSATIIDDGTNQSAVVFPSATEFFRLHHP